MQSLVVTNDIGIVQGRLSPPVAGRLQAFPWASWPDEFARARACGFATLEWVFEEDRHERNPIWTVDGVAEIGRHVAATGIRIDSICADYFMAHPLFGVSDRVRAESGAVLERLIRNGAAVGVRTLLLPVLEVTELRSDRDKVELLNGLRRPLDLAAELGVRIGLETELAAADYRALVVGASHPALGIYYDVGNAAARGFDVAADVRLLGPLLCGIHIKDRRLGGPSVRLGEGDVEFPACFAALSDAAYAGPLILQPATSDDYLGGAKSHLAFVQRHLHAVSRRTR
jgi:hexulose-6-phosphate isomerase